MSAKDWKTLEEAEREGFSLHPWRTKERLIAARTEPLSLPLGTPACLLTSGQTREALDMLAQHAGAQWRYNTLFHFDLRQVDEQGRLVADGLLPLRGRLFEVSTPDDQSAAAGEVNLDVAVEVESPVLRWTKGEHLDSVLARGATVVANTVLRDLTPPSLPADMMTLNEGRRVANAILNEDFQEIQADWAKQPAAFTLNGISAVSVLKPGDLLVIESDELLDSSTVRHIETALRPVNGRALLLEGPAHRVDLDRAKEVLREQGYDVVPLIRWEDVRSWLLSLDCKVEERPERCEMLISQGDHEKDGWALLTMWPARESELIDNLGKMMGMAARAVRAAIEGHVAGKAAAMPVAARRAIEHSRAAGLSTKGASAVIRDAMSKFAAIEQGRDGKGPRIGMLFASATAANRYTRDSALGDKARAFHPHRPPVGERFDVLLVAADVPEDFLRYGLSRCVPGAVIATLAPPQSLGPAHDPQDEPWTAARLARQSMSRLHRLDAACRISDQPNDLRDANLKAMVETGAMSHAESKAAMRDPMQVTTASGGTVDLRDPLSIRAGMRFYSPHWRDHRNPTGVLTVVRPDRSGGWECAEGPHCDPTTAALFLGCNPLYASSVDFAELGAAPPHPAR